MAAASDSASAAAAPSPSPGPSPSPSAADPCTSALWCAAESGDATQVSTLMSGGATLQPVEWSELSDFGDPDVLLAVLRGGFRPSDEQLVQTLINAASFGGSEDAALRHTRFWLATLESELGESVCRAMAQRCGRAMCIAARSQCLQDGQVNLNPAQPTPPLLEMVQQWTERFGGQAQ